MFFVCLNIYQTSIFTKSLLYVLLLLLYVKFYTNILHYQAYIQSFTLQIPYGQLCLYFIFFLWLFVQSDAELLSSGTPIAVKKGI